MRRVINQIPAKPTNLFLNLLPFLLIILIYTFSSNEMTKENPNQKILPSFENVQLLCINIFLNQVKEQENMYY